MKITILATAVVLNTTIFPHPRPQDTTDKAAALIEKLRSADKDEAENARHELLKLDEPVLKLLRDAAAKSEDADFKKRAGGIADRLETRKAAGGLAGSWGDRWYAVYLKGLKAGWIHLKAEAKEEKLIFTDELYLKQNKETETRVAITLKCELNEFLTPVEFDVEAKGPENSGSFKAKMKEDRLVVSHGGEKKALKARKNLITDLSVLRLVTILPRTDEYEITVLETVKPKLIEDAVLKFDKEETLDYGDKKVKTRRFMLSDGQTQEKFYWVDDGGRLLKIQMNDDVGAVLSDEKKAKDLDTDD